MPDILFEGKRKDNGEWIEGSVLNFRENTYIIPHDSEYCYDDTEKFAFDVEYFEVIPETVGRYTGLTDKNGRKIFEGDIVTINYSTYPLYIAFVDFSWQAVNYYKHRLETENIYTVIGNIHDNPELLKQED